MKKVASSIGLSVLMLLLCLPAEAQLLKKLGKRAEAAAERTILNRTDKEVSKGTDKAIDGILTGGNKDATEKDGTAGNGNVGSAILGGSMADVPDAYTFSYRATMRIISDDGEMDVLYWLEPEATYFGTTVLLEEQHGNVTVMDLERQSMLMFMEMEYIPKKKRKDAFRMVCTDLTAEKLAIRKADYQTMSLGGR